ncbi:hypothetical protein SAMN05216302_10559 [Nitrosomonas aestuarii]|uniref:Uncharacterized protein n=1 Tax=Nitrosomonas aestuarii TaxID=52441 RepID=A0A1I4GK07_9PROT|nr:hypothetical protein SAMN05216302_10559 [Nitrosomonas aestuarii]
MDTNKDGKIIQLRVPDTDEKANRSAIHEIIRNR